ncbi:MAG TPA: septum formation initiator family protein [Streptosporangiaceae bacterium]|jgi:cell division protein FtsL|nr:septum formation initiator family protein [Streptosporangiaceae bacterium]
MADPARRPPVTSPSRPARPPLRPTRLTGRAALLAVVMCAIALSLAYPVREYIGQRRQIDQLLASQQSLSAQVKNLQAQQKRFSDPSYIEQQARDQLHMCLPAEKCYVIIGNNSPAPDATPQQARTVSPWYSKVWGSVKKANQTSGK